MSEPQPEIVEPPAPSETGPPPEQARQSEGERQAAARAAERPNIAQELRDARKAAEPKPPKSPLTGLFGEAVEFLGDYASNFIDQRDDAIAERETDQVVNWAQQTAVDYDAEPEQVQYAAEELLDAVGAGDERFREFIQSWGELDPESAQQWLADKDAEQRWEIYDATQEIAAAQQQALDDHEKKTEAMAEKWAEDNLEDAGKYLPDMQALAHTAGLDLSGDPAFVKTQPDTLAAAVRQLDAEATPRREALRTGWNVSAAWEQAEGDRILQAGGPPLRKRSESLEKFAARMAERGYSVDQNGGIHRLPDAAEVSSRANSFSKPGERLSPEQWEAQEQERLSAAWGLRPSVRDELHGKRASAPRHAGAPAQEPPAGDPDDPGGFWSYTLEGRFG
jgi:hypothetical protein